MALSGNIATVTLQGTYVDLNGVAVSGSVRFTPTSSVIDADQNQILVKRSVTATLNDGGFFSVTLPSTDDDAFVPSPIAYQVEELFPGGRTFYLVLPVSSAGVTQDIADLSVAGSAADTITYVTVDEYNALLVRYTAAGAVVSAVDTIEVDTKSAEDYAAEAGILLETVKASAAGNPFLLMGM